MIARSLLAFALLASQCLAENDAFARQFGERNEVAVSASQLEGRAQVDAQFAPLVAERRRDAVADPFFWLDVDPTPSAQPNADALRDRAPSAVERYRDAQRGPVSPRFREGGGTEGSRRDRPRDADYDLRRKEPVQNAVYELVCHPAYCRAENGLDAHGSYDTITRLLDLQNEKLATIKARTTWTLGLMVAFLVYHTLDYFFLAFLARLSK